MASDSPSLATFTLFPLLPPELRMKIWREAFQPRVVEIHPQRDADDSYAQPKWVSNSDNPAVTSVCFESRALALEHFTVLLPVYKPQLGIPVPRCLYFSPASDMLAIIGQVRFPWLSEIFQTVRQLDRTNRGLRRVGMSLSCWPYNYKFTALKIWERPLFVGLDDLVLIMYNDQRPPDTFRRGEAGLEPVQNTDSLASILRANLRAISNVGNFCIMNLTFHSS
ncbi:uncharacterized protein F4812DRAFT_156402 [Daldinia caldariorum]|uniref:uncharacterized protein n=1 Tax=Daldinia caldariorum TaxID=326644 RepID=UPI00200765CF|nr:uncharacterized protein F4812DRAFT_156402 [Daldinia caldariorum]KAI1464484.1 hypothetical protein F4812DRAFT_156402 [Daldinia caldariorum]